MYQYEAETQNGVTGASTIRNGPKVSCKVEIDVPQACSFVLRTSECSLTEMVDVSAEGIPVLEPLADSEAFQIAMEKNVLKVKVERETDPELFPEEDEPISILNIKRGIVSALLVPVMDEEKNKNMVTIHGMCETDFQVNSREDIATDVTVTRDLSRCSDFSPLRDHTSPLAIISGMQYPLSKLISSTQTCNYQFDNQKKHMTSATCTEKHLYLPFSHQNEYGVSSLVKQTMTLQGTSKINDRVFDYDNEHRRRLAMEVDEDKAPVQTSDAVLTTFRELKALSESQQGHQRASIFQRLVTELRGLQMEALTQATAAMVDEHHLMTWQALAQCGTPECTSAMLQILRTFEPESIEVDAAIYALGLMQKPSGLLVKDLLEMAKHKQSKPIMYTLSNVVRKLYQNKAKITPELADVAEFVTSILGADCAGEKELTFLTLRVVGNMGNVMEAADPNIKTVLLKCMRQPATTLSVQIAAIQAFRRMSVTDEAQSNIQRVAQYAKGAAQKRLAAYLILMRKPKDSDLEVVKKILTQEQNMQVKSFVASHIYNILHSKNPAMQGLAQRIAEVMEDNEVTTHYDYTELSREYKIEADMPSQRMSTCMHGNILFDPSSQLPREVMLGTTLKAFGYNLDMWELGMEGKGLEPTIESLFGKNGFFPDTISKAMYWVGDKMPSEMNKVLQEFVEPLRTEKTKRQVPENIVREIVRNFNRLAKELRAQDSPDVMVYLRLMENELGYIKTNELSAIASHISTYAGLVKVAPSQIIKQIMTSKNIFAHYIFMDNAFSLPTASGFPLKFALSGTFAPGVNGGLHMEPTMHEISFSPSMGIEFVTRMGVHIPKFVASAVEMHTNMYHESTLHAKIRMEGSQVKLSIPAPEGTTQLLRVSNRLLMVTSGKVTLMPPVAEGRTNSVKCNPLFTGVKYCTTVRFSTAGVNTAAPYFPLTGESKFALDIQPTGEVTKYTATFDYEALNEGKEGQQRVDSLRMILRAEGAEPSEAIATVRYNRNRNVLSSNLQIPDYDVEAGVRVGMTESSAKGRKFTIDITNKNIPELSLIGRAKLDSMMDGMLQVQMIVPSLQTDAALTASLKHDEELTLELESNIKLPETNSIQKIALKYADDKMEVQVKSDMDSEIHKALPSREAIQNWLQLFFDDILEQRVVKTDMKLRHIYTKSVEAGQIWLDKISADAPLIEQMREKMTELVVPSLPEKLYLNSESTFSYKFNKDRIMITIPVPMGGKTSDDLSIPPFMATPHLAMPQIGLVLPSRQVDIPTFSIPHNYDITLPLLGMVEVSTKMNSNFYTVEAIISGGNNTVETPSYIAKYKIVANSPVELMSYIVEGTAMIADGPEGDLKYTANSSLSHKLIEASFSVGESAKINTDSVKMTGNCKIQAFSPLGMTMSLDYTTQASISSIITGDSILDGSLTVNDLSATTTFSQSFSVNPLDREARGESSFKLSSPIVQVHNKIKGSHANGELVFDSNTVISNDLIKHTTQVNSGFKEAQFTIKSESETEAGERKLLNRVDFTATMEETSIRIEAQADDHTDHAFSLLAGSVNSQGLEVNAEAKINLGENHGTHKGTFSVNKDGLTSSCTTTVQASSLTFENVYHGIIAPAGSSMSVSTKGTINENSAELKIDGRLSNSEVDLNSVYKGDLFSTNTMNTVNFRLSEDGLNLSNNLIASLKEMKTENTHSLIITFESLAFRSESSNVLSERNSYKHNIVVDIKNFATSVNVNHDLMILGVNFINDAHMKTEAYKMSITGMLKGTLAEEELRHTYEIGLSLSEATAKCNTNGKLFGTQITQTSEAEYSNMEGKFNGEARFNSPSLRLESAIQTSAQPMSLKIDASLNSDGELNLYGKHSGQVNSKFLLNTEYFKFEHKHECKASSSHQLNNDYSIETNFQNEIVSAFTPLEQSFSLKTESKINNHAFDEVIEFSNTHDKMRASLTGTVLTNLLNTENDNQEFAISGALNYEHNGDIYTIHMPFVQNLPVIAEEIKMTTITLKDRSIDILQDIDIEYAVGATLKDKASELKQVIESFDVHMFIQDFKNFINSFDAEMHVERLKTVIPTEEIRSVLKSIRDMIVDLVTRYDIVSKISAINSRIEEIVADYKIAEMVENIMDDTVEVMKQYKLKETVQSAINALKSCDIRPLIKKFINHLIEFVKELEVFDFGQMVDDVTVFVDSLPQRIKSIEYHSFADKVMQTSLHYVSSLERINVPLFGKLSGEFEIKSPDHSFKTTAEFRNSTDSSETTQFTANLNSQLKSPVDLVPYTLDATAQLVVPQISQLSLTETVRVNHLALSLDHQGSLAMHGASAQASSKTTVKATTEPYTAELVNNALFALENGFSGNLETSYKHNVNMPVANIFSETSVNHKVVAQLEAGKMTLTVGNEGKGKYSVQDIADEGTHKSDLEVVFNTGNIKMTFTGETDSNLFKMKQTMNAEGGLFSHIIIDAHAETETPFIKTSVASLKVQVQDLKIELNLSHDAELIGKVEGMLSNLFDLHVQPFKIVLNSKFKENTKFNLPLKLSGKVDLQNDVAFELSPTVHQASWTGLARFNQQTYSHYFTVDNGERTINLFASVNGEANLDILTMPITIPEMTVPFIDLTIPSVEDLSLWEDTGLSTLLITPQQTLDINMKLKYVKSEETFAININLETIVDAINEHTEAVHNIINSARNKIVDVITTSSEQGEREEALSQLSLPRIILPKVKKQILIPVMGDLTSELSFKTALLTLNTNAGLINHNGITAEFDALSSSEFEVLVGKIIGHSTMNMDSGLNVTTSFSLEHKNIAGSHEGTIILSEESNEASIGNIVKVHLPFMKFELHQAVRGNTEEGLTISASSPSAGLLRLKVESKSPSTLNGRLYSRYLSEPENDVDILSVTMAVRNAENLNIQAEWNMEAPNAMLLWVKEKVQEIASGFDLRDMINTFSDRLVVEFNKVYDKLQNGLSHMMEKGKEMFKRVAVQIAESEHANLISDISEKIIYILREYQRNILALRDASMAFLRDTKFKIPGYPEKLSGIEVYDSVIPRVADVIEEAIERIPEMIASHSEALISLIRNVEFTIPGTSDLVSGSDILDDLLGSIRKIQRKVITIVNNIGDISLEVIVEKLSDMLKFTMEKVEELMAMMKFDDLEKLSTWFGDVYTDARNSNIALKITEQIEEIRDVVVEYYDIVKPKLQQVFDDVIVNVDIQALIDSIFNCVNDLLNETARLLKDVFKNAEPYVEIHDRKVDIDIPITFKSV